ncbi:hypothetical protein [Legionella israelensis]|uniref:Uncharacterized protein n=1 Tax=Legionella israelensis TaxID=454 RepID=A0A0W0VGJ8_9GAMM|nr:hypothetical protein [Legionella israelensis]KTD19255.1 hypothetical protein Lisr_2105 [Legionella israelensis]QBS09743.1 hypothetical protein E4T55_07655 [Legionella israelensis]SCY53239.1 hypothetical protein SAMN02746069_02775 [Legionella israelensis DSM 19235]STX59283.1 Uncharacterised protein [Legionella israelensis]
MKDLDLYIRSYEIQKNQTPNELQAFLSILSSIQEEKPEVGMSETKTQLFFNAEKAKNNLAVIETIRSSLEKTDFKNEKPSIIIVKEINKNIDGLAASSETRQFLAYVKKQLESIDYKEEDRKKLDPVLKKSKGSCINIDHILKKKKLNPKLFSQKDISLEHDLTAHVAWAFRYIYIPYLIQILP